MIGNLQSLRTKLIKTMIVMTNNCNCNSYCNNDSMNKTDTYDINNFIMIMIELIVIVSEKQ